jgi:predicted SnoaL-like aldol condensation-catalyzing enzyme
MPGPDRGRAGPLEVFVSSYIERVVNGQDLTALDEMVSPRYTGHGLEWPTTIDELRQFYIDQVRDRPDWHIDIQETVEVGDSVVVRAVAGGTVLVDGVAQRRRLEWLAHYRVVGQRITEINLLAFVPLATE